MRHQKSNKKLSRPTDQRIALLRSLSRALFLYSKIQTTDVRAKEAKRFAEKIITLAIKGDLAARRQALRLLPDKEAIRIVFDSIAKKMENRKGGYTRITKAGFRGGDAAPVSVLEFVV